MIKQFGLHGECIKNVLRHISDRYPDKTVFLDIGCGDGTRTIQFQRQGRKLYGIDRINWLKESIKTKIVFRLEDFVVQPLTFNNETFDLIFSFDVIEHLPEPKILLKEVRRILKKDGIFVLSTPNKNRFFNFILCALGLRRFPYCEAKDNMNNDPYAAHVREYIIDELEQLLRQEGFLLKKAYKVFYGLTGRQGFTFLFNFPFFHNIILECRKV